LKRALDERMGALAARWVGWVVGHSWTVLALSLVTTVILGVYTYWNLGLNTDENDLFSEDLPYYDLRAEYYRILPMLADPIVVAVEGRSRARASREADELAGKLAAQPDLFARVQRIGGGPFFERHGLLYLTPEELDARVEDIFSMQPWLAELSRDPSLRGLFDTLREAVAAAAAGDVEATELARVMDEVSGVAESLGGDSPESMAWGDVLSDGQAARDHQRELLIVEPVVDFARLQPAAAPLAGLREAIHAMELTGDPELRIRATGEYVLADEETELASAQARNAGLASFLLVAALLTIGFRSARLVVASLGTLIVGLVWTSGFAAMAIGYVNLISVAFAVLFIGLSIDYAIHLCVRYRDALAEGLERDAALVEAAGHVGSSLWLCASTTAVGFYAFLPTSFAGVAELGLIAGTGMFVSLFVNLTVLPAWLSRMRPPPPAATRGSATLSRWLALPVHHPRKVIAGTALLCAAATLTLPRVYFDSSPLRVRDPAAESVSLLRDMLDDGQAMLWSMNALAPDPEAARALASRLEGLPAVDHTVTLMDFVPTDQDEKRAVLADAAYWILPTLSESPVLPLPTPSERASVTAELRTALERISSEASSPELANSARRLDGALEPFTAGTLDLSILERHLIADLPDELRVLRRALEPGSVTLDSLPPSLVDLMRTRDGRYRVEIEPVGHLEDMDSLAKYVGEVHSVAPDSFGEALMILESGRAVVSAFREALTLAGVAIVVLLFALWRSWRDTALVVVGLGAATLLTVASAVLLGIPFNFANVIVIPLLLGLGVDTGIHLVQRARSEWPADGNLLATSTAGAVVLSALTTLASFGTLGFSSHGGMASLGRLLALGLTLILASNLILLPAMVALRKRPAARAGSPSL